MKKTLGIITIHSTVDLITNSSTEMFCVVAAKSEEAVQKVLNKILKECGCEMFEEWPLDVEPYYRWNNEKDDDELIEGQYRITYEQHCPPCKMIRRKVAEVFEITEEGD